MKSKCYREHKDRFYVYAKPNKCDPKAVTKYIGRYLGRPVIATSRINNYDGENVTFHYNRHEDEKHKIILSFNRWRNCILHSFGYDPLRCPCCGQTMVFLEMHHNHQHISLNEMYERAIAKAHPPSST